MSGLGATRMMLATQEVGVPHDTESSHTLSAPLSPGAVITDQSVPSHTWASGNPPMPPTAMHQSSVTHDTSFIAVGNACTGVTGAGAADQAPSLMQAEASSTSAATAATTVSR